jgi:hypothetical protein
MSISPPHAPPERLRGDESQPVPGDLYSLASTAYFALAGQAPFGTMSDGGALGLIERIMSAQLPRSAGLPAPVLEVLDRAMSKEPADRYPTAREFAGALADAVEQSDGLTVQRSSFTGPPPVPPPPLIDAASPIHPQPAIQPAPGSGPPPYVGAPPVTTSPELGAAVRAAQPDPEPIIAEPPGLDTSGAAGWQDRPARRRLAGVGAAMVVLILVGAAALLANEIGGPTTSTSSTTAPTTTSLPAEQRNRAFDAIVDTDLPLNAAGEQFMALCADRGCTYEELQRLVPRSIVPSLEEAIRSLEELDPPLTDEASIAAVQARIDCLEAYIDRFEREAFDDPDLTPAEDDDAQAAALAEAQRACTDEKGLRQGLKQTA